MSTDPLTKEPEEKGENCRHCSYLKEEHPNPWCENYEGPYQYDRRPKYNDDHKVCFCPKGQSAPTKGEVDFKTEKGFTQTKWMYWCRNCGLALTFAQMDTVGDTWDVIRARQKKRDDAYNQKRNEAFAADGLEDPLA
jgi:hypothetical protein